MTLYGDVIKVLLEGPVSQILLKVLVFVLENLEKNDFNTAVKVSCFFQIK